MTCATLGNIEELLLGVHTCNGGTGRPDARWLKMEEIAHKGCQSSFEGLHQCLYFMYAIIQLRLDLLAVHKHPLACLCLNRR